MQHTLTVFRFTLFYADKLVADIDDADMTVIPHPGMNHPAWILGHLALVADLVAKVVGQPMQTGTRAMVTYGPGSKPEADRSRYPSKAELLSDLQRYSERAIALASSATSAQLNAPNQTPFFPAEFPLMGDLLTHMLSTHPAAHLGQLSAWRRCVGKGSVLGV